MISNMKHWFHRGPTGRILQALLALVTVVICSAGLASAGLTPSPNGDANGQPVWIMDFCDQLAHRAADISAGHRRHNRKHYLRGRQGELCYHIITLLRDSLRFVRYAREPPAFLYFTRQQCRDTR